jgi:hypothetical protein
MAPAVYEGFRGLAGRVGFENKVQRKFNNMQGQR